MRLIDADTIITTLMYDDEHEEVKEEVTTIADWLEHHANEGCPQEAVIRCKECKHCFYGGSKTGKRYCVRATIFEVETDGFCKWGERREMSDMKQCDKCKKMMYEDSRSDKGDYCTVKIDYVDGFSIYHLCKTCYRQFLTEFTKIMTAEEYDDHYGTW